MPKSAINLYELKRLLDNPIKIHSLTTTKKTTHNQALDSLKFIFSVIIVYYHLLHSNMKGCIGGTELYKVLSHACDGSCLIVECFLIIAGYFIYKTSVAGRQNFAAFTLSRFVRLWPVFAFYVLCAWALSGYNLESAILDLSFLRCTGISLEYKGIIWYIPPFFWCSVLLYAILRVFRKESALFIIAILTYLAYCFNLNNLNGEVGRHVIYSWLSLGMLRVLGGLGFGIMIAAGKECFCKAGATPTVSIGKTLCFSLIELICLSLLTYQFLIGKVFSNAMTTVIVFAILFSVMTSGGGYVSKLFSWAPLARLGKYCYSIYVMQQIAFWCMAKTIWKWSRDYWMGEPGIALVVSTLIAVGIGIITYHLVEQPCANWYKRRRMSRA